MNSKNFKYLNPEATRKLDKLLTHPVLGIIIFFLVIVFIFEATFGLGYYPMLGIEQLVVLVESFFSAVVPESIFKSILIDGLIKGVGGVIIFLPNIVILFMMLSLMEETNYIARVVKIMDKLMKPFGLDGRSFISLVMGFGCNVPAIMAAENIQNTRTRIITILINPLMSCSSRFTVYVLFISAFFPQHPVIVLLSIYFFMVFIALILALLLKKFIPVSAKEYYKLELPGYRVPSLTRVVRQIWFNSKLFLKKIGGVILIASFIIWLLGYLPNGKAGKGNLENSYIGMIGKGIEPVIRPLGFDWRMGVSLLSGIAAKETITGTLSELYQAHLHDKNQKSYFVQKLHDQVYTEGPKTGQKVFSPLVALSFMLFVSLYTPCVATISAVRKTTKSAKWAIFVTLYTTALAWLVSFAIYQIGSLIIG